MPQRILKSAFGRLGQCLCALLGFIINAEGRADLWSTGYYPGYHQNFMPPSAIYFGAFTHLIHFAAFPGTNGTIDTNVNLLTPANSSNLISQAHSVGVKVLFCVKETKSRTN